MVMNPEDGKWRLHPGFAWPLVRGHSLVLPEYLCDPEFSLEESLKLKHLVHTKGHAALVYKNEKTSLSVVVVLDTIPPNEEETTTLDMKFIKQFLKQYKNVVSSASNVPFILSAQPIDIIGCGFVRQKHAVAFWTMNRYGTFQWWGWNRHPQSSWTLYTHTCLLQNPNLQWTKPVLNAIAA